MTTRIRAFGIAALAASALLLASCDGNADETSASQTPSASDSSSTSDKGKSGGTETASTRSKGAENAEIAAHDEYTTADTQGGNGQAGGDLLPIEVRSADHDGYARVVVEFDGGAEPGWVAGYVDEAVEQGRGEAINVPGGAILAVTMRGLTIPETDAQTNKMVSGSLKSSSKIIDGLHFDPVFEGQAVLYIGLDEKRPYAVSMLTDPQRVVIDIQQ